MNSSWLPPLLLSGADIPAPGAPAEATFAFLEGIVGLDFTYGDAALDYFAAYSYQSATEIGWNRYPTRHLHGLLRYPRQDVPATYLSFPWKSGSITP